MLTDLHTHHATLTTLIQQMHHLIACEVLSPTAVATNRLKLSRASTARSRYISEVVAPALLARASPAQAGAIRALVTRIGEQRAVSSAHVAQWSGERVAADWAGYRRASARILKMMTERVAAEKALLYPALAEGTPSTGAPALQSR